MTSLVRALRGALAFLTRLPVGVGGSDAHGGTDAPDTAELDWDAFRTTPASFPLAGYVVGALAAVPFVLSLPTPTTAALYLLALYLLTGVTHADGLADLGDAAAVHGSADAADDTTPTTAVDRRRAVMHDSTTGVGGTLALGLSLVALGLGALALVGAGSLVAVSLALAAEVSAKVGMATLVCLGSPAHEGLGSQLVGAVGPAAYRPVLLATVPLVLLVPVAGAGVPAALLAGPAVALFLLRWSRSRLGGVSGDVLGAANELGRVAAIHAGVVAWTLL